MSADGDESPSQADRGQRRTIQEALREIDLERRLFKAKALLEARDGR